jgi:signal transduction histidine kinase
VASLPQVPWGEHLCQFYRTTQDLTDLLVPFFVEGLRNNERCVWVTAEPLRTDDARAALRAVLPDLVQRERAGQIELHDYTDWYVKHGARGADEIIACWLDREAEALHTGHAGLRISGNAPFMQSGQWPAFSAYEARCHRAFASRRILALCSYALDQCTPGRLLDVLRAHSIAIVRDRGRSHALRSATAVMAFLAGEPEPSRCGHTVEIFGELGFPGDDIARWLRASIDRGEAAGAIARRTHLERIRKELAAIGVDIDDEAARERLVLVDADRVFAESWSRPGFREMPVIEQVLVPIARALDRHKRIRFYGELVDRFAAAGDCDGALELERWWQRLLAQRPIELRCGYQVASFAGSLEDLRRVCTAHDAMVPSRGPVEAERAIAERDLLSLAVQPIRDHLMTLQRVMSELGKAVTLAELGGIVDRECRDAFHAARVALLAGHDNGWRDLVSERPFPIIVPDGDRPMHFATAKAIGAAHPELAPASLQAASVVPLLARERVGVLVLGYDHERELDIAEQGLLADVARQIAHAVERARLHDATEASSRAKDEFLAMLGHELRNPLAPILTAVQLMRLRGADQFVKERSVIERQTTHLARLVDDLLDISRIARGKIELQRRPTELASIVAQALEQVSPAIDERGHEVQVRISSGLAVDADAARLAQVFANVIGNAVKYTARGGRIDVTARPSSGGVAIVVRDNGRGIDAELLPRVFELFVQGEQGMDRASGGLGIGLGLARRLVEMHGGTIRADSDGPGCGSAFTIELPRITDLRRPAPVTGERSACEPDRDHAPVVAAVMNRRL